MTTAAAGNLAGQADKDKDKDKVEKRRALGRGLASLLPGPRVVAPAAAPACRAAARAGPCMLHECPLRMPSCSRRRVWRRLPCSRASLGGDSTVAAVATDSQRQSATASLRTCTRRVISPEDAGGRFAGDEGRSRFMRQAESRMPANLVVNLAIAEIDKNPFQTRYVQDDDALEELAESIKAQRSGAADRGASVGRR